MDISQDVHDATLKPRRKTNDDGDESIDTYDNLTLDEKIMMKKLGISRKSSADNLDERILMKKKGMRNSTRSGDKNRSSSLDERFSLKRDMRNSIAHGGEKSRSSSLHRKTRKKLAASMQLESFNSSAGDLMKSQRKLSCDDSEEPVSKQHSYYSINPTYDLKRATVKGKLESPTNSSPDEKKKTKKKGISRKGSADTLDELDEKKKMKKRDFSRKSSAEALDERNERILLKNNKNKHMNMRNSISHSGEKSRSSSLHRKTRRTLAASMQLESFNSSAGDLMKSQKKLSFDDSVEPTSHPTIDEKIMMKKRGTQRRISSEELKKSLVKPQRGRKPSRSTMSWLTASTATGLRSIDDVNALNQMKFDSDNDVASVKNPLDDTYEMKLQRKLASVPGVASVSKEDGYSYEEKLQRKLSSVPGVTSVSKEEGNSYEKKLQGKLSSVPGVTSVSNQENNTEDTFQKRLYRKMSSVAETAPMYKKEAKVDQDSFTHSSERLLPNKSLMKQESIKKLESFEKKLQHTKFSGPKVASVSNEDASHYDTKVQRTTSSVPGFTSVSNDDAKYYDKLIQQKSSNNAKATNSVPETKKDDGPWECLKCTFANESSTMTCAVCNEEKGRFTSFSLMGIPDVFKD